MVKKRIIAHFMHEIEEHAASSKMTNFERTEGYLIGEIDESDIAKAIGKDLDISLKHAVVICDAIRGIKLDKAIELLEGVGKLEKVIPFKKFNTGVGHRSGNVKIGKYPQKAAKAIQRD